MIQTVRLFFQNYPSLLLILSGAISALAFAPTHSQFFAFIGFSSFFYHHVRKLENVKTAFWRGWFFGIGFNIASLYWIGNSFSTVDLWYLVPLGSICLPLTLAFFPAVVTALTVKVTDAKMGRFFAFCLFWSLSEWLMGWIFTGFPWTLVGYMWDLPQLQATAYIGIYGLSALTIFMLISLGSRRGSFIGLSILIWGCLWMGGNHRLSLYPIQETGVNMRIVQASISQKEKWQIEHFEDNLNRWIALSNLESERPLKAIIWSESSVPTFVADYPTIRYALTEAVPPDGYLIMGAPRKMVDSEGMHYYTSTLVLNDKSDIVATYDKSHLVPFGEYIPFKKVLKFSKLTAGSTDYSPGKGLMSLQLQGIPLFGPLICYEAIFSGAVVAPGVRPEWLLNQTNDAWYGKSSGPYQHLAIVRTRAIEEGLPLIRSANNGISAVIDPMGRIVHRLELDEIGFIDFDLPKPLTIPTFFSRYQYLGFWLIVLAYAALTLLFRNKKD
ncbi:apolipoprotein N-acyltransferase [Candidatus Paracaedibacter symbiosus]|uniref:apolipoprotein N-acyltransferase n=1 Tax=Candidatus Paracaedibacter symbiosus TaxID=244582 RepID=UPI000689B4B8|nr:apolipoprotein N-acyltransferase [Candidatus Paracaedibacter symbiosus]